MLYINNPSGHYYLNEVSRCTFLLYDYKRKCKKRTACATFLPLTGDSAAALREQLFKKKTYYIKKYEM